MPTSRPPTPPIHLQRHDSALGRWLIARWRPAHLAGIVDHLWYFEGTVRHARERIFPDGRIEFNVHLGPRYGEVRGSTVERFAPICFSGLLLRSTVIEAPAGWSAVLGVRLLPAAAFALLGRPIHELTGATVDLSDLVGDAATELAERCWAAEQPAWRGAARGADGTSLYHLGDLRHQPDRPSDSRRDDDDVAAMDPGAAIVRGESGLAADTAGAAVLDEDAATAARRLAVAADWVAERVARGPAADAAVAWAAGAIERAGGAVSIAALRERTGWSKSRFATLFREQVGVSPKRLARLVRFRRALELVNRAELPLSQVALAAGYYDQPHFNAEFRELSGLAPGEFLAARRYPGSVSVAEPAR